jgi:hypothetical protein
MSVVGNRYQATASEDREDFMCVVVTVIFGVCNSVRLAVMSVSVQCMRLPIQTPSTFNPSRDNMDVNCGTLQLENSINFTPCLANQHNPF